MINVEIYRDEQTHIIGYHVQGHAMFAEAGKDIVCAGVSSVTIGTVNAIEALLGAPLDYNMDEGDLRVQLTEPKDLEQQVFEKVQLIFETMLVMLNTVEHSYGSYITIKDYKKGGKQDA